MNNSVLRLVIAGEPDVFLVRQRGREVAAEVGLESQDQIRVATALSDIGRDLVRQHDRAQVDFQLADLPAAALVIEFSYAGPVADIDEGLGWETAIRLMDEVRAVPGEGTGDAVIVLAKYLPPGVLPPVGTKLAALRRTLSRLAKSSAVDELRSQNAELLRTLEDLERKQTELTRLNEELRETNQGVLALYKELSDELEQTNRGVVALYAELDEKSNQLREASTAKNRFWSNISHELRTPINSVIGLARLMTEQEPDQLNPEQRHQIGLIHNSGLALLGLVNELLDTAKAESGQLKPEITAVALDTLFGQLRGTLQPTVAGSEVELVIEPGSALPLIMTDEVLLTRILRNLLSNSVKFTQRGEVRLSVALDPAADQVRFEVSDTGIGIPLDQQEQVFEEFYQVRNSVQASAKGTGLGLPYSRRLAEVLGGSLDLSSTPDVGTRVTLRLPLRTSTAAAADSIGTVLVIDDDAEFRGRLVGMLAGFVDTVVEAGEGSTALELIAEHRPDLITLDLRMPGFNGDEVARRIRRDPIGHDIPIIIVTSADSAGFDLSSLGAASTVLAKSDLTQNSLRQLMGHLLAPRRHERQERQGRQP
ncbi:MAG TPA: ATP-binding protein [Pseudonocardiaceae bacterium]|nr:ATP-binding protein [Pseudonocardiaceae bacterium]